MVCELLCGGAIAYKVIECLYDKLNIEDKEQKTQYFIE